MLRRCYGSKAPEYQVKRVRFNLQNNNAYSVVDDHLSVKSERRSTKRLLETFYSNSPSKTPTSMQMNNSPQLENTVDDENNGTREESTTHSEDKHLRLMSKNKLNNMLLLDYPTTNRQDIYSNFDLPAS